MRHRKTDHACHVCSSRHTATFTTLGGKTVWLCSWHLRLYTEHQHSRVWYWLDSARYRWQSRSRGFNPRSWE